MAAHLFESDSSHHGDKVMLSLSALVLNVILLAGPGEFLIFIRAFIRSYGR